MNEANERQLREESAKGAAHESVYNEYVEPFFDQKTEQIFDAWKATPSENEKQLMLLKLQANILEGMKAHFLYFIETGHMANVTLNKLEESNNAS